MAIDSKDDNHQPKGTPNAGRFAPKAGAGDDDDLHEDSFHGMYRPRCMPGNWLGGGFAPPTKDGFDVDPYMRSDAGGVRADADDMAEFRKALPVRPMAMSDREYGEAATVEDGVVRLYSGNNPRIPLLETRLEEGEDPRSAAYRGLWHNESVLQRFAHDCAGRRILDVLPEASRVDDDTVSVPTRDGGHAEIWFDGDTALIQPYDKNGARGLDDWVDLHECGSVDGYMRRIADEVNAIW